MITLPLLSKGTETPGAGVGEENPSLGGIRGQLAGREVKRVRTKCSVRWRLCQVTCRVLAEVMRHGSPPKRQQDLLDVDMTHCPSTSNPQSLPARNELGEVEPRPLAALSPGREIQGLLHA